MITPADTPTSVLLTSTATTLSQPTATFTPVPPTPTNTATSTPVPPTPTNTATPTPVPTLIPISGREVLFSDDFSDPMSGWDLKQEDLCDWYRGGESQYLNDEMVLNVPNDNECTAAHPHLKFDNFILEVASRWSGGAVGGRYGVLFRYQDRENYYAFYLRNNGRYEIGKRANGDWIPLVEDFSDAIDRTGGLNIIHIQVQDRMLVFFVNDQFINAVHDVDHSIGDVVLYAYAPEGAEFFEASFDNLVITVYP
jgi:hypothetical protein